MNRITNRLGWGVAGALAIALLAAVAGIIQAGPLDPPGTPGSTLPQVEPRIPISSAPFTISQPGSYFVTNNLYAASGDGITVAADAVDIDLNGFTLDGPGMGVGDGITDGGATRSDVTVKNGTVRSWGDDGIDLASSLNVRIANISAHYNGGSGIETGSGTVEDCTVTGGASGLVGVRASAPAMITNCVVQGYGTGLALNGGGAIRDSMSSAAEVTGIYLQGGGSITGSKVDGVGGGVGPNNGIVVTGQSLVKDNVITNITNSAGEDHAIAVGGPANTITGNAISFAEYGISLQGASNSKVYENSLSNVTTYMAGPITGGDDIGPERAYDDNGAWDQTLSAVAPDGCNSARFRCVMNNEAVLDRETRLLWERSPSTSEVYDYFGAFQTCLSSLGLGGRAGWRLPTAEELESLVVPGQTPPLPTGHPFINVDTNGAIYWTSTSAPYLYPQMAYGVWMNTGALSSFSKSATHRRWCVRGGQGLDGTAQP